MYTYRREWEVTDTIMLLQRAWPDADNRLAAVINAGKRREHAMLSSRETSSHFIQAKILSKMKREKKVYSQ